MVRLGQSGSRKSFPLRPSRSAVSVALVLLMCIAEACTQRVAAQTLRGGVSTNEYAPSPAPSGPPDVPVGPTGPGIGAGLGGAIGGIVGGVLGGLLSHGGRAPTERHNKTYGEIYQDAAQADAAINHAAATGRALICYRDAAAPPFLRGGIQQPGTAQAEEYPTAICARALQSARLPAFPDRQCHQVEMGALTGVKSPVFDNGWRPTNCF